MLADASTGTRKDIQALRALAVTLVVINHLWPESLPGGYVGVDVFFVISGYLISKHLLGELERSGRIKLGQFYSRRIKRLLPAATVVAVVALAASWLLLPFPRWLAIAQETMASVMYVENWVLAAKSVDYSAHNDAASTVQHYWSLSVEEQFYLVWPLLLVVLFKLASRHKLRGRRVLGTGVAAVSIAAFAFCIWFTYASRSEAYFVTPARVWEFGVGALIAICAATLNDKTTRAVALKRRMVSGVAQWLGYGLIAVSAFAYGEQTFFPGIAAAVPVFGTLLVIASGPAAPIWSPNRLLSGRPVQFIGDVSYSLYLWHWPLIVLAPAALSRTPGALDKLGVLILAVGLAYLSKKLIEDPGRTKLLVGAKPRKVFIAMVVAVVVVCALAGTLLIGLGQAQRAEAGKLGDLAGQPCYGARSLDPSNGCPEPFAAAQVANVGDNEAPWFDAPECKQSPDPIIVHDQKLLSECDFAGGVADAPTVWLVGDSHAEQWKTAVYELAKLHKWKLKESLLGGCPFVDVKRVAFMGNPSAEPEIQRRCLEWGDQLTRRIMLDEPDMVFASSFGAGEEIDDGTNRSQTEQYRDSATKRFSEWTASGTRVFVLRDTPLTLDRSGPECLALNQSNPLACANKREDALVADPLADAAKQMNNPNVNVLDLSDQFCNERTCHAVIGGLQVYFDSDHASRSYIHSTVPVLAERFKSASR
ncbi:acyltransferase [Arthrobacter sp. S39]|nr:acyltransferase [Arthrobacter sp. S39]